MSPSWVHGYKNLNSLSDLNHLEFCRIGTNLGKNSKEIVWVCLGHQVTRTRTHEHPVVNGWIWPMASPNDRIRPKS